MYHEDYRVASIGTFIKLTKPGQPQSLVPSHHPSSSIQPMLHNIFHSIPKFCRRVNDCSCQFHSTFKTGGVDYVWFISLRAQSSSLEHCVLNGEREMYIRYNSSSESNAIKFTHMQRNASPRQTHINIII